MHALCAECSLAETYLFCKAKEGAGGEACVQVGIQVLAQQVTGLVRLVEELEWPDVGAGQAPQPLPAAHKEPLTVLCLHMLSTIGMQCALAARVGSRVFQEALDAVGSCKQSATHLQMICFYAA